MRLVEPFRSEPAVAQMPCVPASQTDPAVSEAPSELPQAAPTVFETVPAASESGKKPRRGRGHKRKHRGRAIKKKQGATSPDVQTAPDVPAPASPSEPNQDNRS